MKIVLSHRQKKYFYVSMDVSTSCQNKNIRGRNFFSSVNSISKLERFKKWFTKRPRLSVSKRRIPPFKHFCPSEKETRTPFWPHSICWLRFEYVSLHMFHLLYCILYTVYCILYIVHYTCILYTVYCILYTVYSVYCIPYAVYCMLYTVCCILYTVCYILCIVHCALCTVYSTLYII